MRIGLVTTSYPTSHGDPSGSFVEGFARALAARGHRLDVLAPEPKAVVSPRAERGVRLHHVPYVRPRAWAETFYGDGVPDNVRRTPRAWPGLLTGPLALGLALGARRGRFDALVSHWGLPCGLLASTLAEGRPHLAVLHSADVHLIERLPVGPALARGIVAGASALWFVSDAHRRRFEDVLGSPPDRPVHVGPMGFTRAAEHDRRLAREALGVDGFVVASVGRLVPVKGIDVAVDAVATVGAATLVVAGDGPSRGPLEARARGTRTRFLGRVGPEERDRLLAAADAFVLPSRVLASGRSEGLPVALLEAMAAGLPIVASEVGGVGELVRHGVDGLLVPPDRPDRLADALSRLASDEGLRTSLGRSARERAAPFAWPALAQRAESLLDGGAQGRTRRVPRGGV
ncbi:MAG: glycosyltransferase family 4 protein [Polyangiales bacterium]